MTTSTLKRQSIAIPRPDELNAKVSNELSDSKQKASSTVGLRKSRILDLSTQEVEMVVDPLRVSLTRKTVQIEPVPFYGLEPRAPKSARQETTKSNSDKENQKDPSGQTMKPRYDRNEILEFIKRKRKERQYSVEKPETLLSKPASVLLLSAPVDEGSAPKPAKRQKDEKNAEKIRSYMTERKQMQKRMKQQDQVMAARERELTRERLRALEEFRKSQRNRIVPKGIHERPTTTERSQLDRFERGIDTIVTSADELAVNQDAVGAFEQEREPLLQEREPHTEESIQENPPHQLNLLHESDDRNQQMARPSLVNTDNSRLQNLVETARKLHERVTNLSSMSDDNLISLFSQRIGKGSGAAVDQQKNESVRLPVDGGVEPIVSESAPSRNVDDTSNFSLKKEEECISDQKNSADWQGSVPGSPCLNIDVNPERNPVTAPVSQNEDPTRLNSDRPKSQQRARLPDVYIPDVYIPDFEEEEVSAPRKEQPVIPQMFPIWRQAGDKYSVINIFARRWTENELKFSKMQTVSEKTPPPPAPIPNESATIAPIKALSSIIPVTTAVNASFKEDPVQSQKTFLTSNPDSNLSHSTNRIALATKSKAASEISDISSDSYSCHSSALSHLDQKKPDQSLTESDKTDDVPPRLSPKSISQALTAHLNMLDAANDTHAKLIEFEHAAHAAYLNEETTHVLESLRQEHENQQPVIAQTPESDSISVSNTHSSYTEKADHTFQSEIKSEIYTADFESLPANSVQSHSSPAQSRPQSALGRSFIPEVPASDMMLSDLDQKFNEQDFGKMTATLIDQSLRKETSKRKEYDILLGVKEKAIEHHAQAEIAYLRAQRHSHQPNVDLNANVRMEQAILVRLAAEKAEIERLRQMNQNARLHNRKVALKAKIQALHNPSNHSSGRQSVQEREADAVEEISEAVALSVSGRQSINTSIPSEKLDQEDTEIPESFYSAQTPEENSADNDTIQDSFVSSADTSINNLMEKIKFLQRKAEDTRIERRKKKLEMTKQIARNMLKTKKEKIDQERKMKREIEHINHVLDVALRSENLSNLSISLHDSSDEPTENEQKSFENLSAEVHSENQTAHESMEEVLDQQDDDKSCLQSISEEVIETELEPETELDIHENNYGDISQSNQDLNILDTSVDSENVIDEAAHQMIARIHELSKHIAEVKTRTDTVREQREREKMILRDKLEAKEKQLHSNLIELEQSLVALPFAPSENTDKKVDKTNLSSETRQHSDETSIDELSEEIEEEIDSRSLVDPESMDSQENASDHDEVITHEERDPRSPSPEDDPLSPFLKKHESEQSIVLPENDESVEERKGSSESFFAANSEDNPDESQEILVFEAEDEVDEVIYDDTFEDNISDDSLQSRSLEVKNNDQDTLRDDSKMAEPHVSTTEDIADDNVSQFIPSQVLQKDDPDNEDINSADDEELVVIDSLEHSPIVEENRHETDKTENMVSAKELSDPSETIFPIQQPAEKSGVTESGKDLSESIILKRDSSEISGTSESSKTGQIATISAAQESHSSADTDTTKMNEPSAISSISKHGLSGISCEQKVANVTEMILADLLLETAHLSISIFPDSVFKTKKCSFTTDAMMIYAKTLSEFIPYTIVHTSPFHLDEKDVVDIFKETDLESEETLQFCKLLIDCTNEIMRQLFFVDNNAQSWLRQRQPILRRSLTGKELREKIMQQLTQFIEGSIKGISVAEDLIEEHVRAEEKRWCDLETEEIAVKHQVADLLWDDLLSQLVRDLNVLCP